MYCCVRQLLLNQHDDDDVHSSSFVAMIHYSFTYLFTCTYSKHKQSTVIPYLTYRVDACKQTPGAEATAWAQCANVQ